MALSPTAATIPMSGRTTSSRRGAERRPSVAEVLWVLPPKCRHHDYARPSTTSIRFTCNCYLAVGQPAFPPNWGPAAGCPGSWTAGCGRTSGIQSHSNPACSSRSGTEPARPCFKHCSCENHWHVSLLFGVYTDLTSVCWSPEKKRWATQFLSGFDFEPQAEEPGVIGWFPASFFPES